ncbi:unnamed protein product [Orchesella dallaii]|uniref:F-box domain-containing protein n=1 Tax=Orchesella dallaii TaxID=48710 RepID=A0ABP1QMP6_9HEXA
MVSLDVLPNEVLSNILGLLTTNEKFRARQVCSRWKGVVDELVPFYRVILCNENYDEVAMRFGRRRVLSLGIPSISNDYNKDCVPIQNLSNLRHLSLASSLSVDAMRDLVTRADKLIELQIYYGHCTNWQYWHDNDKISALLPALRKVKKLLFPQLTLADLTMLLNSWKPIIQSEMPELQHWEIDVTLWNPPQFNFFELATFKPHLRELMIQDALHFGGLRSYNRITAVWDVKSRNTNGLRKLKLIGSASLVINKTPQLENLLSNQYNLEELQLYDSNVPSPGEGYTMSIIEPVLTKSMETLHTIRLDIGAEQVMSADDFDMEIFSQLAKLRELHLSVRVVRYWAMYGDRKDVLRRIKNCNTVISATLRKLVLHGFTFSAQEADDCITEIAKLDLEKVELLRSSIPEISTVWKWFSRRARKMGLKKGVQAKTLYLPAEFIGVEFYFEHTKSSTC